MKECTGCFVIKPLSEFFGNHKAKDKKASQCKACSNLAGDKWRKENVGRDRAARKRRYKEQPEKYRDRMFKYRYGISGKEFEALLQKQDGVCAICKLKCRTHPRLSVDHCHTTGKVRGLLCADCNSALGRFKDSPLLLLEAVKYLQK